MNLPSWYDGWLSNDPSDQPEPPECRCGNIMEWDFHGEVWFCADCENKQKEEEEVQP